jgi:hypothetical protein
VPIFAFSHFARAYTPPVARKQCHAMGASSPKKPRAAGRIISFFRTPRACRRDGARNWPRHQPTPTRAGETGLLHPYMCALERKAAGERRRAPTRRTRRPKPAGLPGEVRRRCAGMCALCARFPSCSSSFVARAAFCWLERWRRRIERACRTPRGGRRAASLGRPGPARHRLSRPAAWPG